MTYSMHFIFWKFYFTTRKCLFTDWNTLFVENNSLKKWKLMLKNIFKMVPCKEELLNFWKCFSCWKNTDCYFRLCSLKLSWLCQYQTVTREFIGEIFYDFYICFRVLLNHTWTTTADSLKLKFEKRNFVFKWTVR